MPLFGTQFIDSTTQAFSQGAARGQQAAESVARLREARRQHGSGAALREQQARLAQYQADAMSIKNQFVQQLQQNEVDLGSERINQIRALLPGQVLQQAAQTAAIETSTAQQALETQEWVDNAPERRRALELGIAKSEEELRTLESTGELLRRDNQLQMGPLGLAIRYGAMQATREEQLFAKEQLEFRRAELGYERELLDLQQQSAAIKAGLDLANVRGLEAFTEMMGTPGFANEYLDALSPQARAIVESHIPTLEDPNATPEQRQAAGAALQQALQFDDTRTKTVYKQSYEGSYAAAQAMLQMPAASDIPASVATLVDQAAADAAAGNYRVASSRARRAQSLISEHLSVANTFERINSTAQEIIAALNDPQADQGEYGYLIERYDSDVSEAREKVTNWLASHQRTAGMGKMAANAKLADFMYTFGSPRDRRMFNLAAQAQGASGYMTLDEDLQRNLDGGFTPNWAENVNGAGAGNQEVTGYQNQNQQ